MRCRATIYKILDSSVLIAAERRKSTALTLLKAGCETFEFEDEDDNDERANLSILEHLSNHSGEPHERCEVWLVAARGRELK